MAVIDMLVAGIVLYDLFYLPGVSCHLWKWHYIEYWTFILIQALMILFPIASLTNITIIALERVHATFFPLRHRVLRKWVYRLMIAVVWVTSGLLAIVYRVLLAFKETDYYAISLFLPYLSICLFIICISYTSIVTKVRCGAQPRQHHGAASRERKLTMTLFIVTVVSLILYLPFVIFFYIISTKFEIRLSLSISVVFYLDSALAFSLYANSLVNPILYAIRMPEYRSAVIKLFRKRPQHQREVVEIPLRGM